MNISQLPSIPDDEKSPLVLQLFALIRQQAEEIQQLKDEIARLKKHPRRPSMKPSQLGTSAPQGADSSSPAKRPGSTKRQKTAALTVHETLRIAPLHIPEGSTCKGYTTYTVQDLRIAPHTMCYELEQWETPDGSYVSGVVPASVTHGHFGETLVSFILYQYYHGHVTQPLLLEQLREYQIDMSAGQLSRLLTEEQDRFHQEKEAILAVGRQVSRYLQVDDTGARHQGRNGYCTYIGNAWFSWFESTESKSRINFLTCLQGGCPTYALEPEALTSLAQQGLPTKWLTVVRAFSGTGFANEAAWQAFLSQIGLTVPRPVQILTEGALVGGIVREGIAPEMVILSDGAGQFAIFVHALCWIHAERSLSRLILETTEARIELDAIQTQVWELYAALKAYQHQPEPSHKSVLSVQFDTIFTTVTSSESLNAVLERLWHHKTELLRVLDYPEIPLHNNGSEQAIREYVKRRKISGSTRSEAGRQCRDTFTSLKQTCRKLGVSCWEYLCDRIGQHHMIPPLDTVIQQRARAPG